MSEVLRRECKYLLNYDYYCSLRHKVSFLLKKDIHNDLNGYNVRSLYFDTLYNKDYEEKVEGFEKRIKIRVRNYDIKSDKFKLEVKSKAGDLQRKVSININRENVYSMCNGDYQFLLEKKDNLCKKLYFYMNENMYKPVSVIEYKREAFIGNINDVRITFDSKIMASPITDNFFVEKPFLMPIGDFDKVVLEVKYNNFLPEFIKNVISLSAQEQISYSKYYMSRCMFLN